MSSFEGIGINKKIIRALTDLGFESPTPVQEKSIPLLIAEDVDLVSLAQTGTGKTAAFGIPLLNRLDTEQKHTQALILCPTRELCLQISRDLKSFSKHLKGIRVVSIYGGASISGQIKEVKEGAQVIVGTPGRMVDMIDRKAIRLNKIERVVLDEADEMLSMGFKDDLDKILSSTPEEKNTWLFSATMPKEVARIASKYMHSPKEITVGNKNEGAANIEHLYYMVSVRDKYPALKRIADFYPDIFAIVFCRTRMETQKVADQLIKDGYNADALHGDLSQAQRDMVMKRYRSRTLQMLVATDVAARGIDVNDVTHVINYNIPDELESYTHRSGRTARAGKSGVSILLVSQREFGKISALEKITGKKFKREKVPNGMEVCGKQLISLIKKIHDVPVQEEAIKPYMGDIMKLLDELPKEELIKRFVSVEFNRFLDYYKNAPDLNESGSSRSSADSGSSMHRLFINLGKLDGLTAMDLEEELRSLTRSKIKFFNTEVKNAYTFTEVEGADAKKLCALSGKNEFNGRPLKIEQSEKKGTAPRRSGGGGQFNKGRGGRGGGYKGKSGGGGGYHKGGNSRSGGERRRRF